MARKPAVQTPPLAEPADRLELGRFRKQLLPVGLVDTDKYPADLMRFDAERLKGIAQRFKAGVFDMVPLLLASDQQDHPVGGGDPERVRGVVTDVDVTDDGLFAEIRTSAAGDRLLREHPSLPVSVRLVADKAGEALGHVLATLDPAWKGQTSWQLIEASDDRPVIDLSGESFAVPSDRSPTVRSTEHGRSAGDMADTDETTPQFTQEHADVLDALGKALKGRESEESDEDRADALLASILGEAEGEGEEEGEGEGEEERTPEVVGASMSAEDRAALELSKTEAKRNAAEIEKLQKQLAKERFGREKDELLGKGCPPILVELAGPVLTAPKVEVIELAGGKKVDPQDTIRKMLHAAQGLIEFSEIGNGDHGDLDEDREQGKALAKQMAATYDGKGSDG